MNHHSSPSTLDRGILADAIHRADAPRLCHDPDSPCGQCAARVQPEIEVRFQERSRMGRELHDSTAQTLVALQLKVLYLKEMFDDRRYRDALSEVQDSIHKLHQEIRAVSLVCNSPQIWSGKLPEALRQMARRFAQLSGLSITFRSSGRYVCESSAAESSLFRIAQEALANVYRHAEASAVQMRLESTAAGLRLEIDDDGIGISPRRPSGKLSGIGLQNIRARVRELNGKFVVRRLTRGSRLSVTIPARTGMFHGDCLELST